ncbi:MAG: hypothetical protein HYX85_00090 [Chloroflexi bacterium]|nr:hypothetical protein [Chloroflexota bacterium]
MGKNEQLVLEFPAREAAKPASHDVRGWIRREHERAELQRLEEGWLGCGCGDCEELYGRIDLSKYGKRVQRLGGTISIGEDKAKRARDRDCWTKNDSVFVHYGKGYAVDKRGRTYCTGPVDDPQPSPDAVSTAPGDATQGQKAVTEPSPMKDKGAEVVTDNSSGCVVCGGEFTAKRRDARYCSSNCRVRAKRQKANGQVMNGGNS